MRGHVNKKLVVCVLSAGTFCVCLCLLQPPPGQKQIWQARTTTWRETKQRGQRFSTAAGGSVWFHVHKAGRWFRMRSGSFEKELVFHQNVIGMPSCEHSGPLFAQRAKPRCWQESICSPFIISSVLFRRPTTTRYKIFAIGGWWDLWYHYKAAIFVLDWREDWTARQRAFSNDMLHYAGHGALHSRRVWALWLEGFLQYGIQMCPFFQWFKPT